MKPVLASLVVATSLIGASVHAAPASVQQAFGNTIVSTYPDGRKAELWLEPGGAYTAKGRRGDSSSGTWKLKGAKLCLSQQHPFAAPFSFCTPVPTGPAGSTWIAKAVTGETVQVSILTGHG